MVVEVTRRKRKNDDDERRRKKKRVGMSVGRNGDRRKSDG